MAKDKAPSPIVTKTPQGIQPVNASEAERLFADPVGTEYDLVKRSVRSNPHNSMYWAVLRRVRMATGMWPTDQHLHNELKLVCGFRMKVVDWETGEITEAVDSTSFEAMTQAEFCVYFDHAMAKLADYLGTDPLTLERAA